MRPAEADRLFGVRFTIWIWAVTAVAAYLALKDLGDLYFFSDEGETLTRARHVLTWGLPKNAGSGYTFCENWMLSATGPYPHHPWMQYYLAAGALAILGDSPALVRLPFALIGLTCVPLLFLLANRLRVKPAAGLAAAALLATSVPFLTLIRNVRYYALSPFFGVLTLIFYLDVRAGKRRAWITLGLVGFFYLHAMHIAAAAVFLAIALHALLTRGEARLGRPLGRAALLAAGLYLPYAAFFIDDALRLVRGSPAGIAGTDTGIRDVALGIALHLGYYAKYIFPTLLVPVFFLVRASTGRRDGLHRPDLLLVLLTIFSVLAVPVFLINRQLSLSYVLVCTPLVLLLAGVVIAGCAAQKPLLAVALTAVVMFSNTLNLPYLWFIQPGIESRTGYHFLAWVPKSARLHFLKHSWYLTHIDSFLSDYWLEIHEPFLGSVEAVVGALKDLGHPGQTFFAQKEAPTIQFGSGLRALNELPFASPPDWIVRPDSAGPFYHVCSASLQTDSEKSAYMSDFLAHHPYEEIVLNAPEIAHENAPISVHLRLWSDVRLKDAQRVILLRRRHQPAP